MASAATFPREWDKGTYPSYHKLTHPWTQNSMEMTPFLIPADAYVNEASISIETQSYNTKMILSYT